MTEQDDDEASFDGGRSERIDLPDGLSGGGEVKPGGKQQASEPDYQIVETDDEFRPLSERPREELRGDDAGSRQERSTRQPQTKAERRASQRQARDRTTTELQGFRDENAQLRKEIEDLKGTVTPRLDKIDESRFNDQVSALDRQIAAQAEAAAIASSEMSDAVMAGDRDAHNAAHRKHTLAVEKGRDLAADKARMQSERIPTKETPDTTRREQPRDQRQAPRIDPEVDRRTREFAAKHTWLDLANAGDRDTRRALFIDNEVRADGFDPRDDDYWDELEDRLKEVLPHRFETSQRQRTQQTQRQPVAPQRRGPMVAGQGNGGSNNGGPRQVLLSPERKVAMMEVGAIDRDGRIQDRPKFNRLAAGYATYDRENGIGAARQ